MKIEANKYYLCTDSVVMRGGNVAYTKGKYYKSVKDGNLTDDMGQEYHTITADFAECHFKVATDDEATKYITMQYIEEVLIANKKMRGMTKEELCMQITAIYEKLATSENDRRKVFTIYSDDYDWGQLDVRARNSDTKMFENCSAVGRVTIVLMKWEETDNYDEYDVETEMRKVDWEKYHEDYTLYNDRLELVGFVYSERK